MQRNANYIIALGLALGAALAWVSGLALTLGVGLPLDEPTKLAIGCEIDPLGIVSIPHGSPPPPSASRGEMVIGAGGMIDPLGFLSIPVVSPPPPSASRVDMVIAQGVYIDPHGFLSIPVPPPMASRADRVLAQGVYIDPYGFTRVA